MILYDEIHELFVDDEVLWTRPLPRLPFLIGVFRSKDPSNSSRVLQSFRDREANAETPGHTGSEGGQGLAKVWVAHGSTNSTSARNVNSG